MIEIDISSDIRLAMHDTDRSLMREVPYALALTINSTLEQARERVVGTTYRNAFTVRNTRLPNALFTVDRVLISQKAGSADLGIPRSLRAFKHGEADQMVGRLRQRDLRGGDRDYFVNHAEGGTKTPRGSTIAVPADSDRPGLRASQGKIKAINKPYRITHRRDTFLIRDKSGRKRFIARRLDRNRLDFIYFFARTASIKKNFRFYEDSMDTAQRLFRPTFVAYLNNIIARSRFN